MFNFASFNLAGRLRFFNVDKLQPFGAQDNAVAICPEYTKGSSRDRLPHAFRQLA
jgi:hypothetical protein